MNNRLSIINRPRRDASQNNVESSKAQHDREQEYWAGRAERSSQLQERMTHAMYPAEGDVAVARQKMFIDVQQHAKAAADATAAREQLPSPHWVSTRPVTPEGRPWIAATMDISEEDEVTARRRYAAEVAAQNQQLAEERAQQRRVAERQQQRHDADNITSESSFWNLGAASQRWIAPEHRARLAIGECRPTDSRTPPWAHEQHSHAPQQQQPQQQQQQERLAAGAGSLRPPWAMQHEGPAPAAAVPLPQAAPAASWACDRPANKAPNHSAANRGAEGQKQYPWSWNT